ncbi:MAG: ATP-grasp domain-containing protein, partial [Candidatus Poribacteria bacterium]
MTSAIPDFSDKWDLRMTFLLLDEKLSGSELRKYSEALNTNLEILLEQGDVSVQENFIGMGVGVELLAAQGESLFAFQHVRVHEPIMGGGSSYRKSVALDSELLEASTKLLKALNYTGVAMVEFKVNFKTGAWVFIEINARFWGSLPLAVAAGADFPYYLYQLLVMGKRKFPQCYKIV